MPDRIYALSVTPGFCLVNPDPAKPFTTRMSIANLIRGLANRGARRNENA